MRSSRLPLRLSMRFGMTPPVALQTESAHVAEVAFATAFDHRHDMIGIPQGFAAFQTPDGCGFQASNAAEATEVGVFDDAIGAAECADAFVAFEDAFTQMGGI